MWSNKIYNLKDISIFLTNKDVIKKHINTFFDDIVKNIDDNQHILLLFRVQLTDKQKITIGNLQKINNLTKGEDLLSFLLDRIGLLEDAYKNIPINSIIFSYGIRVGKVNSTIEGELGKTKNIKFQTFYRNKLPLVTKPEDYGKVHYRIGNTYTIGVDKNTVIILEQKDNTNIVKYIKNNTLLFEWKDTIDSPNKFVREIGKSIYHFEDGNIKLYKLQKKTTGMTNKVLPKNNKPNNKFITMDIETILVNNIHIPYLLCWYDGIKTHSYFNTRLKTKSKDMENSILDMVNRAMTDISRKKYKDYRIYLHNFSKFDGYFLLKYLSQLGDCEPVIHKGKIISNKFRFYNSKYSVTFMDSYLTLPASLKKLCKSFASNINKSFFPFYLKDINYKGKVPDFKYFSNINLDEYNQYKYQFIGIPWNFKDEAIKYCNIDCISLYQILTKFNELIFNHFDVNITKYPTLPSLAFGIFRTHYLVSKEEIPKDALDDKSNIIRPIHSKIHMLSGIIANNIRKGYTGGSVDMYIPKKGKKIYAYDVNSLYPYVMKSFKYPIGSPTYFEGDILKIDPKAFGFFYCKITAPSSLKHPILQTHVKTKDGTRTIAPLGTWEGMYFSEELYNAIKYGYKFEIL